MSTRLPLRATAAVLVLLSAACAAVDPPAAAPTPVPAAASAQPIVSPSVAVAVQGVRYACDNGLTLRARFEDGTVTLAGLPQGDELLLRDAGGVTPEQTVWSNERLRAEFGLPPAGEGAALHLLQPPGATFTCQRQ